MDPGTSSSHLQSLARFLALFPEQDCLAIVSLKQRLVERHGRDPMAQLSGRRHRFIWRLEPSVPF